MPLKVNCAIKEKNVNINVNDMLLYPLEVELSLFRKFIITNYTDSLLLYFSDELIQEWTTRKMWISKSVRYFRACVGKITLFWGPWFLLYQKLFSRGRKFLLFREVLTPPKNGKDKKAGQVSHAGEGYFNFWKYFENL